MEAIKNFRRMTAGVIFHLSTQHWHNVWDYKMHIDDDHQHYGSAIIQVAEDEHSESIAAWRPNGRVLPCAFRINKNTGLYLRYCSKPKGKKLKLYYFQFSSDNLKELAAMHKKLKRLFLGLICVKGRQVCCLPYDDFQALIEERKQAKGKVEAKYTIEVCLKKGEQFRVWISTPGEKNSSLDERIVPRNDFPTRLFT